MTRRTLPPEIRAGRVLYGNDLSGRALEAWFESERDGFARVAGGHLSSGDDPQSYSYRALYRLMGKSLRSRYYETALVLGCANGLDVQALDLSIGRIIAIEPSERWHADKIGEVPAEYRVPALDGTLNLPDSSVDLVVAFGVLHHIPNVEYVVAELGRVLKRGGRFISREPATSMGDFTKPRPGLTPNERGISPLLMRQFIERAGLHLDRMRWAGTVVPQVAEKLGVKAYNSAFLVRLDAMLSWLAALNYRYWRPRLHHKFAPVHAAYWATKL